MQVVGTEDMAVNRTKIPALGELTCVRWGWQETRAINQDNIQIVGKWSV